MGSINLNGSDCRRTSWILGRRPPGLGFGLLTICLHTLCSVFKFKNVIHVFYPLLPSHSQWDSAFIKYIYHFTVPGWGEALCLVRQAQGQMMPGVIVSCILHVSYTYWRPTIFALLIHVLSYGHMGGMRLRTNFAAESRVVTWSCGDRSVSKETYCVAYNLTGVWRITFQPQRPLRQFLTAGLRQFFCLIRRTHRTAVHSMWPLLLKRYQSKMFFNFTWTTPATTQILAYLSYYGRESRPRIFGKNYKCIALF